MREVMVQEALQDRSHKGHLCELGAQEVDDSEVSVEAVERNALSRAVAGNAELQSTTIFSFTATQLVAYSMNAYERL